MTDELIISDEERAIIEEPGSCKISATAGSGKTTSLILKAASLSPAPVLILCFNRAAAIEVEDKAKEFGLTNVYASTAHALAHHNIVKGTKLQIVNDLKSKDIVQFFKLRDFNGEENSAFISASFMKAMLMFFYNSTYTSVLELEPDMFPDLRHESLFFQHFEQVRESTLELHAAMTNGELPMVHDTYLKLYSFQKPILQYDYIFFDEGQDASPVMLDIFMRQNCQKVIVGDEHQQIYSFRYAVNAMRDVDLPILSLTKSFRFGENIASTALAVLNWKTHLGIDTSQVSIRPADQARGLSGLAAVIARSNLELFQSAVTLASEDHPLMKKIYFEGNFGSYQYTDSGGSLYDVFNLYSNKRNMIKDPMISGMRSIDELKRYADTVKDRPLKILIDLVETHKSNLISLMEEIKTRCVKPEDRLKADLIFTTAHKSKGLEYDEVYLETDFISEAGLLEQLSKKNPSVRQLQEEINLLYVAMTRSKGVLALPDHIAMGIFS